MTPVRTMIVAGVFLALFSAKYVAAVEGDSLRSSRSQARASLIPYPQKVKWSKNNLSFRMACLQYDFSKVMMSEQENQFCINDLRQIIEQAHIPIGTPVTADKVITISLQIKTIPIVKENPEAYQLEVSKTKITITAQTTMGMFYGIQTFRQLIQFENDQAYLPCCEIMDWPAFSYRGFMHDVGRNFQDVALIKQHLDLMARYKMNLFHFHLSDKPGYRIECRKYPQLNAPQNYRSTRQPGKFYTYEQMNEIMAYAKQRNIQIVPEIDMPGHSDYFKNTFGFDMQDPQGIEVLKEMLTEFFEYVDTPLFHIGSDEVHLRNPAFMKEIAEFIRNKGRKVIVWRPGHLPDNNVITQLWTGAARPIKGIPYMDSQANYINHMDALVGPIRVFFQQPCRVPHGNELALGGVLCHWPDNNINSQMDIYRQSPVYPAMVTYAERIWRGIDVNREDCWAKLPPKTDLAFQEFVNFEKDLIIHRDTVFKDLPFPYIKQTHIPWKLIGPFDHGEDPEKPFPIEQIIQDEYTINGKKYIWTIAYGGTIHINHFFGFPGHLPSVDNGTAYALTYLYADTERTVDFWIGFNGFSRAGGRRGGPSPKQGQWSNVNSMIWVNDQSVPPPQWANPGLEDSPEIPFVDEDYFYRPPTKILLNKGWNKLLIKAPKTPPAWKWMFTCVPVQCKDGRCQEVCDLIFSLSPNATPK